MGRQESKRSQSWPLEPEEAALRSSSAARSVDTDKDVTALPESNVRVRLGRWRAIAAEETEEEADGPLRCASFLFR